MHRRPQDLLPRQTSARRGGPLLSSWLGVVGVVLPSCINLNYVRSRTGEPTVAAEVAALVPGEADFTECLARLGAPELVWPSEDGNLNVAYAWSDVVDWGISFSWSFQDFVSAGAAWDSVDHDVESVVLSFDAQLRLARLTRGYLWDLAPSASPGSGASRMLRNTPR